MSIPVGVAVRAVDVAPGTPMAGFAARTEPSTGVHDATTVRALVLGETGIVTIDVCALHESTCRAIEESSALPTVIVAATHTHSGPSVGCGRLGPWDQDVHDALVDQAVAALDAAQQNQVGCRASWAREAGIGVAHDRRRLNRTIDPPLTLLRFIDAQGGTRATLGSFPCHPVVLDASNTKITGDYIHFFRAAVEEQTNAPCLFLTGAAGDVNTGHSAATSFSQARNAARTFARARDVGAALANAATSAAWSEIPGPGAVTARTAPVSLGWEPLDAADVAQRQAEFSAGLHDTDPGRAALMQIWHDWAQRWQPDALTSPWEGRVGCVQLGAGFTLVTLPGEPFLAIAEELQQGTDHPVLVVGYCDGVPGYVPTSDAYPDGGYEVADAHMYYGMPAPFARGSADALMSAARRLMQEA